MTGDFENSWGGEPEWDREAEYQPRSSKQIKPKSRFSKIIVVLSILTILAYTSVVLFFVWHDRYVPDSLTYSFFAAFAVELSALAGIKVKDKQNYNRRF